MARAMGLAPYDARLKLAVPPPVVVASGLSLEPAQELLGVLRQRGHGAVACDAGGVPVRESALIVRGFTPGAHALDGIDDHKRAFSLPYAQILGIVRAVELSSETQTVETTEKKLAIGRALLSGGVMLNKSVTKVATTDSATRQQVAYVFRSSDKEPVLLEEHRMSYEGLGAQRASSTHKSFDALIGLLRRSAPGAMYDDRLVTHKRRADLTGVRGLTKDRTSSSSNAPANMLAAYLLMLAHLQEQL